MLANLTVIFNSNKSNSLDDQEIRNGLIKAGINMRYSNERRDSSGRRIELGDVGSNSFVYIDSAEHHQDLARRNLSPDFHTEAKAEISKFIVFCGAYAPSEAKIYVTRVTAGSMNIWIEQSDAGRLTESVEYLLQSLMRGPLKKYIDHRLSKEMREPFTIFSTRAGSVIASGSWSNGRFIQYFANNKNQLFLWFAVLFVCLFLKATSQGVSAVDASEFSKISAQIWPNSAAAFLMITISIISGLLFAKRQTVNWGWRK